MIKFFRQIRQNFIMKNQTGKYFKYAIGEILLVVLGILIALQINNWNQSRIDKKSAIIYHKRLIEDIDAVIERSTIMNDRAKEVLEAVTRTVNTLENEQELTATQKVDLDFSLKWLYRFNYQVPTISTIDEMKSNGQLNLIYNSDLRKSTLSFSGYLESVETIFNNLGLSIHTSLQYLDKLITSHVNTETLDVSHEYDFSVLSLDREFINKFSRIAVHWRANVFFTKRIQTDALQLKEAYVKELEIIQ